MRGVGVAAVRVAPVSPAVVRFGVVDGGDVVIGLPGLDPRGVGVGVGVGVTAVRVAPVSSAVARFGARFGAVDGGDGCLGSVPVPLGLLLRRRLFLLFFPIFLIILFRK
eukprot:CAMPEP_0194075920 /NCGR_PEP_ID=MMETSP0149-20130528/2816_1 /TAXON_ID=122233 /ORGANISM="Chaetoceros debilis, Strain MM31A-1" /LENGTH=108 /DNA_ID=CAMNT_0038756523 /DNA_START=36 /DNA_END=359 /DNA_ORIENTATION=+